MSSDDATVSSSIQVIKVTGKSSGIRGCSASGDGDIRDRAGAIAARVPEDVVLEVANICYDGAVEGEGIRCRNDTGAPDVDAVEVIAGGSAGNISDTLKVETGGD